MRFVKLSPKEIQTSIILYLVFLCILIGTSCVRGVPGYMDESYYLVGARNLSTGKGFQEEILWNFMDDPQGLPHPSHLYWMPLVSIVSAIGISIFGSSYIAATLPIALISAFIAPLLYLVLISWIKDQFWAVIGSFFSICGGYYFAYYSAVDSFGINMLLGFGYFVMIAKIFEPKSRNLYLYGISVGVIAGFMHLIRAEGLLWAGMIPVFFGIAGWINSKKGKGSFSKWLLSGGLGMLMYFLIMFPWFFRNLGLYGTLTPLGSTNNLFLTSYNDLFHYPAAELTANRWLSLGWSSIIMQRIDAAGINLLSLIGVQMLVVMSPLFIIGVWKNRRSSWVKVNLFGLTVVFLFFTLVFPLAGARGSFFHTGTSFQIFIWSMAIYGLRHLIGIMPLNKDVDRKKFEKFFSIGFLVLLGALSGVLFTAKLRGWDTGVNEIALIEDQLMDLAISDSEIILVNDPATFHWVTERPSIVIPSGKESTISDVMDRYGVNYVILQINHPPELNMLYQDPGQSSDFRVVVKDGSWLILRKGKDE